MDNNRLFPAYERLKDLSSRSNRRRIFRRLDMERRGSVRPKIAPSRVNKRNLRVFPNKLQLASQFSMRAPCITITNLFPIPYPKNSPSTTKIPPIKTAAPKMDFFIHPQHRRFFSLYLFPSYHALTISGAPLPLSPPLLANKQLNSSKHSKPLRLTGNHAMA